MNQHNYELFASRLDWDYPALDDARALYEKGKLEEAVHQVVAHFRTRTSPVYLFEKKDVHCDDPRVMVEAGETMRHYLFGHQFEGPIDWLYNPTMQDSQDNEWSWSLFRTLYWQPLARAYAQTGDETYVREFVGQMRSFVSFWKVEPFMDDGTYGQTHFRQNGHAWRTLESGARIYTTWLPCFEVFRSSQSFDDDSFVIFLNSLWDHATFLASHYSNHKSSSNWLSMEVNALVQLGVLFPEFADAKGWRTLAIRRFSHEIRYDFDENGVHMERTPVYHLTAAISFLQAYLVLTRNGYPVPDYCWPILVSAADYVAKLVKPDLSTPMIGDADREDFTQSRADRSPFEGMNLSFWPQDLNEIRAYFLLMARMTGRKDFLFLATCRKEGEAPKCLDVNLHEGIWAMRSGFGPEDDYLLVHGVNIERGEKTTHSHGDQGHVELMAKGEDLLVDCGRFVYNSSVWKDWRHYFTFQPSHNVLDVDGHQMGQFPGQTERIRGVRSFLHHFVRQGESWLIDVSHNGYAYLEDPVWQRRQAVRLPGEVFLVIDRVTGLGEAEHDMKWYLNFAPGKMEEVEGGYRYTTAKGNQWRLAIHSSVRVESRLYEGSLEPKYGWISYGYSVKQPTPEVVASVRARVPLEMVCVIAPEGVQVAVELGEAVKVRYDGCEAIVSRDGMEVRA